jgi:hypothetical protein
VLTYSEIRCKKSFTHTHFAFSPTSLRQQHISLKEWKYLTRKIASGAIVLVKYFHWIINLHFIRNKTLTFKMAQLILVPFLVSYLRSRDFKTCDKLHTNIPTIHTALTLLGRSHFLPQFVTQIN